MQTFEVGKLLQEGKTRYQEGVKFDFQQAGAVLLFFYNKPDEQEINDIRKGAVRFGFYATDDVIFMLFKFGTQDWVDAPYSVHLSKDFEFENIKDGMGFGVQVILTDASTGIIKAMRLIGLHTRTSTLFKQAVSQQKRIDFDINRYNNKINEVYANYSTKELVKRADIIENLGGEK